MVTPFIPTDPTLQNLVEAMDTVKTVAECSSGGGVRMEALSSADAPTYYRILVAGDEVWDGTGEDQNVLLEAWNSRVAHPKITLQQIECAVNAEMLLAARRVVPIRSNQITSIYGLTDAWGPPVYQVREGNYVGRGLVEAEKVMWDGSDPNEALTSYKGEPAPTPTVAPR